MSTGARSKPLWSIVIPCVFDRINVARELYNSLLIQSKDKPVQVFLIVDNRMCSIGTKRNICKDAAYTSGAIYWSMIDDDDFVEENYVDEVLAELYKAPEQVTYNTYVTLINKEGVQKYGVAISKHNNPVEEFKENAEFLRPPIHAHVWKTDLVKDVRFPDKNYNEDFIFEELANKNITRSAHINKVLHYYRWAENLTLAGNGKDE